MDGVPRTRNEARRVSPPGGAEESNLEPLDLPPQWGWSDEIEPPPEDWWWGDDLEWHCLGATAREIREA